MTSGPRNELPLQFGIPCPGTEQRPIELGLL